jgi:hypothetical protein
MGDGSFYTSPRELRGAIKVSLYADGKWFVGLTEEFVRGCRTCFRRVSAE